MKAKRTAALFLIINLFMAGCSSNSQNALSSTDTLVQENNTGRKFFDASSSYFEHITSEESENVYIVKGTVHNENDGNAVITHIRAEKDTKINILGTPEKKEGADTKVIYVAPDGTETKIGDNSSETFEVSLDVISGDGIVRFEGETAIYDFQVEFELCDGVSFSDL